jgi:hypothetical protein
MDEQPFPSPHVGREFDLIEATDTATPRARERLVGLAFSGGGIRSATFGLGVLEALKHANLLGQVHYLSSVSGGGYISAWFSANCVRAAQRRQKALAANLAKPPGSREPIEPDWRACAAEWGPSIRHLRRYSNYLSPEVGFFSADTWSMFTVWLRNALLVQSTVVVAMACVLLLPRVLILPFARWYSFGEWRWIGVALFIVSVVGIAGNQQWVSRGKSTGLMRAERWPWGLALAGACIGAFLAYRWRFGFEPFIGPPVGIKAALFMAALLVIAGYGLLPGAVKVYGWLFTLDPRPEQVNYSQGQVQRFIVIPLLATGFCVGAVLWAETNTGSLAEFETYGRFLTEGWRHWPFPLAVVFFSLWLLSLCSIRRICSFRDLYCATRDRSWTALKNAGDWAAVLTAVASPLACVGALHALLCAIMLILHGWGPTRVAHAFVLAPPLVLFAFSLTVVVLIGMMGRQSTEGVREWWSRLGAWLLIYGAAWMLVTVVAVYGPAWVSWAFHTSPWTSLSSAAGWLGTVAAGLFAGHSEKTGRDDPQKQPNALLGLAATVAPFLFIAGLLLAVATALDAVVRLNTQSMLTWWCLVTPGDFTDFTLVSAWAIGATLAAALLLGFRIDINAFSLNAFYRSRLVRCYLGATRVKPGERAPQNFTGFDDDDDLLLSDLRRPDGRLDGPLHIVNCALNLGGSGDLALHTRHSDSFTLTLLAAGSDYTHVDQSGVRDTVGYTDITTYGSSTHQTTLGQAIAVSGAAASPNMGYHTSPVVAFLLTMFNLRLGWWFPNPAVCGERSAPRFNLPYMFAELFGSADYRSKFLMVSDGGHFENLATYELIKRRCKVIILSDAECDPDLAFEGLGTLIRMCEVDLGVLIDIDVGSLHRGEHSAWSEQRCAIGSIIYPPDEDSGPVTPGTLVYLKASMTGHEPTSVLQYKASHPAFPHETTGDQFYAEDQFESYRRLGFDVTKKALDAALAAQGRPMVPNVLRLADDLAKTCAPSLEHVGNFTEHSQGLIKLWDKMRAAPALRTLDAGMLGRQWPAQASETDRLQFYTCAEMIQLMENVYLDLHLEDTWEHADNRGWQALFKVWAASPIVKDAWVETGGLFGTRFQYFCQRNLQLPPPRPKP